MASPAVPIVVMTLFFGAVAMFGVMYAGKKTNADPG